MDNDSNKKITLNAVVFYIAFLGVLVFSFIAIFSGPKAKPASGLSGANVIAIDIQGVLTYKTCLPLVKAIRKYSRNPGIRGLVLRINSPGGSVGGVQELYRELMNFKAKKKVIVATMGDIAASGGYYIAMAADYVFANKGSLVGSIGVIINTFNFHSLAKRFGIKRVIIKAGEFKDMLNSFEPVNQREIALMQKIVDDTYKEFFSVVKKSRSKVKEKELREYCDGRVFSGNIAYENKLVDGIGGYYDAIEKVKELAKLPGRPAVKEHKTSPALNFLKMFKNNSGTDSLVDKIKFLFQRGDFASPLYYLYTGI